MLSFLKFGLCQISGVTFTAANVTFMTASDFWEALTGLVGISLCFYLAKKFQSYLRRDSVLHQTLSTKCVECYRCHH